MSSLVSLWQERERHCQGILEASSENWWPQFSPHNLISCAVLTHLTKLHIASKYVCSVYICIYTCTVDIFSYVCILYKNYVLMLHTLLYIDVIYFYLNFLRLRCRIPFDHWKDTALLGLIASCFSALRLRKISIMFSYDLKTVKGDFTPEYGWHPRINDFQAILCLNEI